MSEINLCASCPRRGLRIDLDSAMHGTSDIERIGVDLASRIFEQEGCEKPTIAQHGYDEDGPIYVERCGNPNIYAVESVLGAVRWVSRSAERSVTT